MTTKKLNILIIILLVLPLSSFAQGGYETAMKTTLAQLGQAQAQSDFLTVANKFERIAKAEQDKWLPYYYTAFAKTLAAALEDGPQARDTYLDEAEVSINSLQSLTYNKVEVLALQAFVSMIRIAVDPGSRGQQYSQQAAGFLEAAMAITTDNPRVVFMMAQLQFGTAKFFNADTGPACARLQEALALFAAEEAQADPLAPAWGQSQAEEMLTKCGG